MLSSNLQSVQLSRCGDFMGFSIKSQGHPNTCLQVELCNLEIVCILMIPGQLWRLSELLRCKHPWTASKRCLRHPQNNKGSHLLGDRRFSGSVEGGLEALHFSFLVLSGAGVLLTSTSILNPSEGGLLHDQGDSKVLEETQQVGWGDQGPYSLPLSGVVSLV